MCRIRALDICRGLLICLVVAGHLAGMVAHWSDEGGRKVSETLFSLIYSFHMPAFFFLAGLTCRPIPDFRSYFVKKAKRLLVPYFAFGITSAIFYLAIRSHFSMMVSGATDSYYCAKGLDSWWHPFASLIYGATWPGTDGFRCNSVLWFLPCLFTTQMLVAPIQDCFLQKRRVRIVVYLAFLVTAYLFSSNNIACLPWGLNLFPWYAIFYFVGIELSSSLGLENGLIKLASSTWFVCLASLLWIGSWLMIPDVYYSRADFVLFLPIVCCAILGTLVALSISVMIDKLNCCNRIACALSSAGASSIGIMLLHKYFLLMVVLGIPGVKVSFASGPVWYGIAFVMVAVFVALASWFMTCCIRRFLPIALGEVKNG